MPVENAADALAAASSEVLELMFFISVEETPCSPVELPILAQVEFRGQWTGRCLVEMPEIFARTMACNFTGGSDPDEVKAEIMIETICEFVNMVCGSTITRLRCPGIVALSPPHLIEEWPGVRAESAERWLDTGEGMVHVSFEAEAAA
jgi:CheY-specific phosphatase CheX